MSPQGALSEGQVAWARGPHGFIDAGTRPKLSNASARVVLQLHEYMLAPPQVIPNFTVFRFLAPRAHPPPIDFRITRLLILLRNSPESS